MKSRSLFISFALLLVAVGLAVLIVPVQGQDPIPEATSTYWPLTFDPATVTVDPDAFTLIFASERRCFLAPNETSVFIAGLGFYDLDTGEKRFRGRDVSRYSDDMSMAWIFTDAIYDVTTGQKLLDTPDQVPIFSPDSRWFIYDSIVYERRTGQQFAQFPAYTLNLPSEFVGDGHWFHTIRHGTLGNPEVEVMVFETDTWRQMGGPFKVATIGDIRSVFSYHASALAVNEDGVFDRINGEKRFALPLGKRANFSPDGTLLAVWDERTIQIWDAQTGELITQFDERPVAVRFVVIAPDNRSLIAFGFSERSFDSATRNNALIDMTTGETRAMLPGDTTALQIGSGFLPTLSGSVYDARTGNEVFAGADGLIRLTPDGRFAYSSSIKLSEVRVYDTRTWQVLYTVQGARPVISADSRWLVVAGAGVYDTETGELAFLEGAVEPQLSPSGRFVYDATRPCAIYRMPED